MYTIINEKTDKAILKNIKLETFKDYQAFLWKMFELYSINVLITGMTDDNFIYVILYDTYTNNIIEDIEINQSDYDNLIYPL